MGISLNDHRQPMLNLVYYRQLIGRGFIKVFNRRATEFDTRAKNWQGPEDVFSCILKPQTMTFNNQKKITFLDNLIMI